VVPSLHVDYKHSRIKQYHKEGRALRTETTINDTRDYAIGRGLTNLSALRKVGFQANRRLLDVQRLSHDCAIADGTVDRVHRPGLVDGQRVAALRFLDPRVWRCSARSCCFGCGPTASRRATCGSTWHRCSAWRPTRCRPAG
jgi:hypothetical protein